MIADRPRKPRNRGPLLLLFAVLWVPLTVLVTLPLRRFMAPDEPLDEAVLNAALTVVWIGPAMSFSRLGTRKQARRLDPQGDALRQAVRHGTVPENGAVRGELPAYLVRQRRQNLLALAFVLPVCLSLGLFGVLVAGAAFWALLYGLVAAVCVGVAALTLVRVGRLERRLTDRPARKPVA